MMKRASERWVRARRVVVVRRPGRRKAWSERWRSKINDPMVIVITRGGLISSDITSSTLKGQPSTTPTAPPTSPDQNRHSPRSIPSPSRFAPSSLELQRSSTGYLVRAPLSAPPCASLSANNSLNPSELSSSHHSTRTSRVRAPASGVRCFRPCSREWNFTTKNHTRCDNCWKWRSTNAVASSGLGGVRMSRARLRGWEERAMRGAR